MNKRIIHTLLFIISCGYAFGQTTTNNQAWYYFSKKLEGDSLYGRAAFYMPVRDTNWTPTRIGAIVYKSTDQTLYVCTSLTGAKWQALGASGGSWGSITGTLSAQTDLQTALNAKQNSITLGTTSQYFKGNLTLGTFSTDVQTVGDALYSPLSHTHTASNISDFTTAGRALLSAGSGISYNASTGVISATSSTTYSAGYGLIDNSGTFRVDTFNIATRPWLYKAIDSAYNVMVAPRLYDTYNTHDTLTQSRLIDLNDSYGLTFTVDGTNDNATGINASGFVSKRGSGNSDFTAQDGWIYGQLRSTDGSYVSRFQTIGLLNDSTHSASFISTNGKTFNRKAASISASWNEGVKLQVNTAWKTSGSASGYKGLSIENGNGLGWAPLKIDREVLSVGTGTDSALVRDAATGEIKLVAQGAGGGSSLPSQTGNAGKVLTTDGTNASWTDTRPTLTTLTDGGTITWDYSTDGTEAKVTLAGNRTLSITNLPSGKVVYLTLEVIQDATGSRTLTLPASTKVIDGGAGAVTLTTTGSATDIITFRWNGTTLFANMGPNYN
jgi:hypothetical protein